MASLADSPERRKFIRDRREGNRGKDWLYTSFLPRRGFIGHRLTFLIKNLHLNAEARSSF